MNEYRQQPIETDDQIKFNVSLEDIAIPIRKKGGRYHGSFHEQKHLLRLLLTRHCAFLASALSS